MATASDKKPGMFLLNLGDKNKSVSKNAKITTVLGIVTLIAHYFPVLPSSGGSIG